MHQELNSSYSNKFLIQVPEWTEEGDQWLTYDRVEDTVRLHVSWIFPLDTGNGMLLIPVLGVDN
jgi:hypothetical protein